MALLVSSVVVGLVNPSASVARQDGDEWRERQQSVEDRIGETSTDIHEISAELLRAQRLVEYAEADLSAARAYLAGLREQVAQAELYDTKMQAKLEKAQVRLENARMDLAQGQVDVTATRSSLASYAVSNYQSGGIGLSSLGVAFDSRTAEDAVDSIQDVDTVVNKESVALQELQAQEVLLTLTQERVFETKRSVRENRLLAAENLENKRLLEAQAAEAEREVALRVKTLERERQRVQTAKRAELKKLRTLERERDRIERMLRELAERRARQHQRKLEREAQQQLLELAERRAQRRESANGATPPAPTAAPPTSTPAAPSPPEVAPSPSNDDADGGILAYPGTDTFATSPYGMRMHPILQVYKLHDGLDLAAACGSEVYASADGQVAEASYNSAYGNRVIIDHGYVAGVSLATSYNHMTSFVADPGDAVTKGQLIGYAGNTGYSTGCHMHFMVYVNGGTVDPVTWL